MENSPCSDHVPWKTIGFAYLSQNFLSWACPQGSDKPKLDIAGQLYSKTYTHEYPIQPSNHRFWPVQSQ